jgi:hypothetical protein
MPAHHIASYVHAMNEAPTDRRSGAGQYEIQVKGHLSARWNAVFDGFTLRPASDGTTVLAGFIVDQAALFGVLRQLADLGLPLLSISSETPAPTDHSHQGDRND